MTFSYSHPYSSKTNSDISHSTLMEETRLKGTFILVHYKKIIIFHSSQIACHLIKTCVQEGCFYKTVINSINPAYAAFKIGYNVKSLFFFFKFQSRFLYSELKLINLSHSNLRMITYKWL